MSAPVILIVEDEKPILDTLRLNLELEGFDVLTASDGIQAKYLFYNHSSNISLIILDIMLPEISGHDLCHEFKSKKPLLPVMFLSAKNQSSDKISGLKLGADDYLTKPFDLEELLLRVHNILKRYKPVSSINEFTFAGGNINFETFEILTVKGDNMTLSKREIGLLQLLTAKENKVVSRDEIIEKLWSLEENPSSRTIDNYILNFRKYFELNPKNPQHFHSIRGVGYKFTA